MKTVIFACVHNAGRSQMAAAFFNEMANGSIVRAISAGTDPGDRVHPEVVEVMRESDIRADPSDGGISYFPRILMDVYSGDGAGGAARLRAAERPRRTRSAEEFRR